MQEMWVPSLGQKDPLEKEMTTHSQNSCLGNRTDRGAWWAAVHGVAKSGTWLGYWAYTHRAWVLGLSWYHLDGFWCHLEEMAGTASKGTALQATDSDLKILQELKKNTDTWAPAPEILPWLVLGVAWGAGLFKSSSGDNSAKPRLRATILKWKRETFDASAILTSPSFPPSANIYWVHIICQAICQALFQVLGK